MAELDWTNATGSATTSAIAWAVSAGYPKPNGGGTFAHGFNSLDVAPHALVKLCACTGFAPTAKAGSISAAMMRGLSSGKGNFAPLIFLCLTGTNVTDTAYILGLGDGDPSHFILRKGDISSGLPDDVPGNQGVLRQSTDSYPDQVYYHLQLEAVWNTNGDVVINCYQSDLNAHSVVAPVWVPIPGMTQFIDDNAGIASGSAPLASGYTGFGFRSDSIGRRAYIDHVRPAAQN